MGSYDGHVSSTPAEMLQYDARVEPVCLSWLPPI